MGGRGGSQAEAAYNPKSIYLQAFDVVLTELVKLVTFILLTLTIGNRCGDMSEIITPILLTWPSANSNLQHLLSETTH